ncbi:porin family protein [Fibrella aquatica]|jgi:Outer membrane protein beta-barrel domain|uniref:porin family protein n=1 Tax=Fibrella aquatica TaxID=3242487 RepID=UPI00351FAC26
MRLHQLFACAAVVLLPLGTLAQTASDSLSATPSSILADTLPEPSVSSTVKLKYAPGGYGPSALLNNGHFGFKVGPSLTSAPIQGVSPSIPKRKMDFHLGVMYRYRFTKFVVQPELLYQVKGGTYQQFQIASTNRTTTENNFNYVSLPIMFGYIPVEGLTLQAGPEFSWALSTPNGPQSSRDLGVALGLHYDFLDMADKFSLNLRYVYGLTKIPETVNSTLQNRALQLSVIYNFYKK